jgi:hypothetical protein
MPRWQDRDAMLPEQVDRSDHGEPDVMPSGRDHRSVCPPTVGGEREALRFFDAFLALAVRPRELAQARPQPFKLSCRGSLVEVASWRTWSLWRPLLRVARVLVRPLDRV